jgi:hypothetical protein
MICLFSSNFYLEHSFYVFFLETIELDHFFIIKEKILIVLSQFDIVESNLRDNSQQNNHFIHIQNKKKERFINSLIHDQVEYFQINP